MTTSRLAALACWGLCLMADAIAAAADGAPSIDANGTIQVPSFALPQSPLLPEQTRAFLREPNELGAALEGAAKGCPPLQNAKVADVPAIRKCQAEAFYQTPFYLRLRAGYSVSMVPQTIGGVHTEVFTPAGGIAPDKTDRVLLNVHGGGFSMGARTLSHLESIPIAALARIKVISIDYRMAPEASFPAASQDVAAVYREVLKSYKPENVGLFGCSAGGLLTAQSVAWFLREKLPLPGAVGMFCAAGAYYGEGDSGAWIAAMHGVPPQQLQAPQTHPYFKDAAPSDSLAFPVRSDRILTQFPPSLLLTSTRDQALSSVAHMHSRLVAQGVDAELHVWEGLGHAFLLDAQLPQSREAYDVIVRFFTARLGKPVRVVTPLPVLLERQLSAEVDQFVKSDQEHPPEPCQLVFVGSSTIVRWKTMQQDMAPLPVINRGFGGTQIEYVNRWFKETVAASQPAGIVFYAGENDISAGKPVKQVLADFDRFMALKTAVLGKTPVYFISLKPSKLRFWELGSQSEVNAAIRKRAAQRADLHYIDVAKQMLTDGRPKDLYATDDVHLNPDGYALWTSVVRAALLPRVEVELDQCRKALNP